MAGRVISRAGYGRLLADVWGLLEAGRAAAESAAGHLLAVTYWKVGRRILEEEPSERAGYGQGVVDVDTGFREGRYLNAELVRYGHATVYWDPARA